MRQIMRCAEMCFSLFCKLGWNHRCRYCLWINANSFWHHPKIEQTFNFYKFSLCIFAFFSPALSLSFRFDHQAMHLYHIVNKFPLNRTLKSFIRKDRSEMVPKRVCWNWICVTQWVTFQCFYFIRSPEISDEQTKTCLIGIRLITGLLVLRIHQISCWWKMVPK